MSTDSSGLSDELLVELNAEPEPEPEPEPIEDGSEADRLGG